VKSANVTKESQVAVSLDEDIVLELRKRIS